MNVTLLMIGNTTESYVKSGLDLFVKRLDHYIRFKELIISDLKDRKNLNPALIKEKEAVLILEKLMQADYTILLDENGLENSSVEFSEIIQKIMNTGTRELFFVIGGAYGVADSVKQRADKVISLSRMTFTHQLIRLIFVEQLYRAMTILKNEPYHNI